ncbi:MAG: alpha-hydroxy-acid oxidizing protein [Saprospiraceae bacterium]|nr:alpha-hydroxy-acid oxidizing protein [Saprospiraceae bacterium]
MELGRDWLKIIFSNRLAGTKPCIPVSFELLQLEASKKLSKNAFDYIFTGAGTNQGVTNNRESFKRYRIKPHMLQGCENPSLETQIFNNRFPLPFYFSPIGVLELAHLNADLELAIAAKNTGLTMIYSNQASKSMETCSSLLGTSNKWFQLYFSKSRELVESLVSRAEQNGCTALVLTLDTTTIGWRVMDLENAYLPFIYGKGLAQYTSDPVFNKLMNSNKHNTPTKSVSNRPGFFDTLEILKSYPDTLLNNLKTGNSVKAIRCFFDLYSNPDLSWDDITWLRTITKLPIVLKGILHEEDARKALDSGIDGIIVSNHGGRQIDQVFSSLDALRQIKKILPSSYPLLFDSGIRSGTDIFIALALGAKAIGIGRPYVYALALKGHVGVETLVQNLASELMITMSLCGCKSIETITSDLLTD